MKFGPVTARIFLATVLFGTRALAQNQPIPVDSCIARIPASTMKRVPVFLEATADSAARAVLPAADLFSQSVAFKIRELLGSDGSRLPEADSLVQWTRITGEVVVVVRRDAQPVAIIPDWSREFLAGPRSSLALIQRAVSDVIASGETVALPQGARGDSMSFGLTFVNPLVTKQGQIIPVKGRQPIPVFTIGVAWTKPVELTKFPNIVYPEISRTMMSIGNVRLAFRVDKSGKVETDTIEEVWPAGLARPKGELLNAYEAFVRAAKRGLPSARFSPAVIGGCVVSQRVVQTFEFKFRDYQ